MKCIKLAHMDDGETPIVPFPRRLRFRGLAFIMGMTALILYGVGCQAPAPAATFVDQAERLHDEALASTVASDADLNDYLQEIVSRIAGAANAAAPGKVNETFASRIRCHLVNCDTINAFSTGGTHIYVTNALFRACEDEDELAAAVAHAFAHLVDLDIESTGMRSDSLAPASMIIWQFSVNRFSREQERQADALAMKIHNKAGWEPGKFAALFERSDALSSGSVAPDRDSLTIRASHLRASLASLEKTNRMLPVADPQTFLSLRQRASLFHEPADLPASVILLRAFPNCVLSGDTSEQRDAQRRLTPLPRAIQRLEPN